MARTTREVFLKASKWRTLETHWSTTKVRFYFRGPRGASIRVGYGFGWFSKNRQKQKLDGNGVKTLSIGAWGATRAKIQMAVPVDNNVTYDIEAIGP
jgi:hypothetical protein